MNLLENEGLMFTGAEPHQEDGKRKQDTPSEDKPEGSLLIKDRTDLQPTKEGKKNYQKF
jgi:hypothetical protein